MQTKELTKRKNGAVVRNPTHSETWKLFERDVAAFFGVKRTPLSGMSAAITKSDIIHPELFIECKYRNRFTLYEYFIEKQKEILKEFNLKKLSGEPAPTVVRIRNVSEYLDGDIWVFSHEDLNKLTNTAKQVTDVDGVPRMIIFKNKVNLFDKSKNLELIKVYSDAVRKANLENKVPLGAIKMKNKKGWLILCNPIYLNRVNEILNKYEQQQGNEGS